MFVVVGRGVSSPGTHVHKAWTTSTSRHLHSSFGSHDAARGFPSCSFLRGASEAELGRLNKPWLRALCDQRSIPWRQGDVREELITQIVTSWTAADRGAAEVPTPNTGNGSNIASAESRAAALRIVDMLQRGSTADRERFKKKWLRRVCLDLGIPYVAGEHTADLMDKLVKWRPSDTCEAKSATAPQLQSKIAQEAAAPSAVAMPSAALRKIEQSNNDGCAGASAGGIAMRDALRSAAPCLSEEELEEVYNYVQGGFKIVLPLPGGPPGVLVFQGGAPASSLRELSKEELLIVCSQLDIAASREDLEADLVDNIEQALSTPRLAGPGGSQVSGGEEVPQEVKAASPEVISAPTELKAKRVEEDEHYFAGSKLFVSTIVDVKISQAQYSNGAHGSAAVTDTEVKVTTTSKRFWDKEADTELNSKSLWDEPAVVLQQLGPAWLRSQCTKLCISFDASASALELAKLIEAHSASQAITTLGGRSEAGSTPSIARDGTPPPSVRDTVPTRTGPPPSTLSSGGTSRGAWPPQGGSKPNDGRAPPGGSPALCEDKCRCSSAPLGTVGALEHIIKALPPRVLRGAIMVAGRGRSGR